MLANLQPEETCSSPEVATPDDKDAEEDEETEVGWWHAEDIDLDLVAAATQDAMGMAPIESRDTGASAYGRRWEFAIGLVGKPSAGKSTFFNAATKPPEEKAAAMADHPFTTIEPNLGLAVLPARTPDREERDGPDMLISVKDVAGLVPGAYLGRGRGNTFLQDLVQCDALIHVVDVSGSADRNGVVGSKGDPLDDIVWVQQELHLWIFSNLRKKWAGLRRRVRALQYASQHGAEAASRLALLFSGYHASEAMLLAVLDAAGFRIASLTQSSGGLLDWTEADVHRLVAVFLRARFPVVLALNKADRQASADNVARVLKRYDHAVPTCALAEYWLMRKAQAGQIVYDGEATPELTESAVDDTPERLSEMRKHLFDRFGGTGTRQVLRTAIGLRNPMFLYPVSDAETLTGLGERGSSTGRLGTCVLIRPFSTVSDAFAALRNEGIVAGEFVRSDQIIDGVPVVKRKGDVLEGSTPILKIVTKKQQWQKR